MVKISALELENVKRIRAVQLQPAESGLTVIGGNNAQGKTSVLDAIAWALGGEKFRPSKPTRDGSEIPARLKVTLSNGLTVERSGEKGTLKVTDPSGCRGGQTLLNAFVEQFALNLPAFLALSDKKKAEVLLRIIGIGDRLQEMEDAEQKLYSRRTEIGRIADQKAKHAADMPYYPDVPAEPISVQMLIELQQEILTRNAQREKWAAEIERLKADEERVCAKIAEQETRLSELRAELAGIKAKRHDAAKTPEQLAPESTAEIEAQLGTVEETNAKIRANAERKAAQLDARDFREQYDELTAELETARKERLGLLDGADMPLDGLSVEDGVLTYKGQAWDCMSGSEQLICAASIVRKLNPACGFVLLDKLEQLDLPTLTAFGAWLEKEGLQAIATRVSTGGECSIIIEDGYAVTPETKPEKTWKAGEF